MYIEFCELVAQFATSRSLPVLYMGRPSGAVPPDSGRWLEVRLYRNENIEYGVADDGPAPAQGFFRVLVCDRPGQSVVAATEDAEALSQAIPKGTAIGDAFIERRPGIGGPIEDDDRVLHPVTFRYRTT